MKMNPQSKIYKVISVFLALTIFLNAVSPMQLFAMLTNGSSQPEIYAYQPIDATDNVSLSTGAFNYTIPVTSIPEYPMAISYRSGVKPDQEAGMFGLGFYGFSGAIGRNVMGIPDDMKDVTRSYKYDNQVNWNASLGGAISASVLSVADNLGIGVSLSVTAGYDNYTGMFGSCGLGLGVSAPIIDKSNLGASAGIGISTDSRCEELFYGGSVGLTLTSEKAIGDNYHPSGSLIQASIGGGNGFLSGEITAGELIKVAGINKFPSTAGDLTQTLAPLSNVIPTSKNFGISLSIPIPVTPPVSLTATYNRRVTDNEEINKKVFGYQYLKDYDRRDNNHLADFTVEGEVSFPTGEMIKKAGYDPRVNPGYLQRDFFIANAMGLSGTMQLNQKEYGIVSRNTMRTQSRDISLLSLKTERYEVYPWVNVESQSFNKSIDIIKILKSKEPDAKDFDKVFFKATEEASLTEEEHKFGETAFKMRGDMAGEYNMASSSFEDQTPNMFDLVKIASSRVRNISVFGVEQTISLYKPDMPHAVRSNIEQAGEIETSTNIQHKTIDEIREVYRKYTTTQLGSSSQNVLDRKQNFYFHSMYQSPGEAKNAAVDYQSNLQDFNIIDELINNQDIPGSAIGWIEVLNASGMKYIFNLPVFAKNTESLQLEGYGGEAPVKSGDDYKTSSKFNRGKNRIKDEYNYPYAWLLTAIVGEDYIDFDDIPGPSDGDIGFWVRFKYTKTSDNYRWRYPFTGLMYHANTVESFTDDTYSMMTGEKEVYVLDEIESSGYVCKYNYQKRFDGLDAKAKCNGEAINPMKEETPVLTEDPTGDNFQFVVTQIDLYKKHPSGNNSEERNLEPVAGKKIKSTKFEYDYSLCPGVPNNLANYQTVSPTLEYLYNSSGSNIGTGKLTLRKIQHIAYDEDGEEVALPSYTFDYWTEENPSYDSKCVDIWGNYNKRAKSPSYTLEGGNTVNFYHSYCEYDEAIANENARVYHLKCINLPSGGALDVDYQGQSYAKVEDKKAYAMRRIDADGISQNGNNTLIKVDVQDIVNEELKEEDKNQVSDCEGLDLVLKQGDIIYGEIAYHQEPNNIPGTENKLYVSAVEAEVVNINSTISTGADGRYYQEIELASRLDDETTANDNQPPFIFECEMYMYEESEQVRSIKESITKSCIEAEQILEGYEAMEKTKALEAVRKVATNARNAIFRKGYKDPFNACYGTPADTYEESISFIRTPVYKAKYTGTRVKEILFSDNFQYASLADGTTGEHANSYGTIYLFDEDNTGNGVSAGVATVEPMGGKAAAIDIYKLRGAGYLPSPSIISSKTAVANIYNDENTTDNIYPREKGKTVYEFFAPDDKDLDYKPTQALQNAAYNAAPVKTKGKYLQFGIVTFLIIKFRLIRKQRKIKIPLILPLTLSWMRQDEYRMHSYSYLDYTDIYGRPKSITQVSASGEEDGKQSFVYYGVDEAIPVYKNGWDDFSNNTRPGKMDQMWSEAYYSKETNINLIPWILTFTANTKRHLNFTNMKYSYIPPVMKEVITQVDGIETETRNTGFDYYTCTPVEVRSNDSYGNEKIKRTVPAYWEYSELGPVFESEQNLNKLTAKTGAYMYLNTIDEQHVLGASVTCWDKNNWIITDYLMPDRIASGTDSYKYIYEPVAGEDIKNAYSLSGKSSDKHIKRNASIYKPTETYTYEVDINTDGTFASFTPFDYEGGVNTDEWKRVNKNEIYSANGVLLQASDVLNKYASQHLGYNFSNAISTVANASYAASVFEGAENVYELKDGSFALENNRVELINAEIFTGDCIPLYTDTVLKAEDYLLGTQAGNLQVVSVSKPSISVYNKVIGNVKIKNNYEIDRSYFISITDNGNYKLTSSQGEDYTGFIVLPNISNTEDEYLLFDLNNISSIYVDPTYNNEGYNFSLQTVDLTGVFDCSELPEKEYTLPTRDCFSDVHTGNYAFSLASNKSGTEFTLASPDVNAAEFKRKYKALVWVLNTSPLQTELVMKLDKASGQSYEVKTDLNTPYATAGNWKLLRLDFDLTDTYWNSNPALSDKASIFVRNSSEEGTVVYDDFRVLPYHAEMSNYVYDHLNNRVTSTLDADNFASYNEYDARGRVTESAVEIEELGIRPVKKMLYNDQKKD